MRYTKQMTCDYCGRVMVRGSTKESEKPFTGDCRGCGEPAFYDLIMSGLVDIDGNLTPEGELKQLQLEQLEWMAKRAAEREAERQEAVALNSPTLPSGE